MTILFVVDRPADWPVELAGVEVITARRYLTAAAFKAPRGTRVFNLCHSYRYQSFGYYVSLLAAARGHRPLPSVLTSQDLRTRSLVRLISEDLDEIVQRSLGRLQSDSFDLSVYFGRNIAKRYERLSLELFNLFPAPLLRARFAREEGGWRLRRLRAIGTREIPDSHWDFVIEAAKGHFAKRSLGRRRRRTRYDLAILRNPKEAQPPSNERALKRFVKAGEALGFGVELIEPRDFGRVGEYDALFIRETTYVNHHTYRFSRRAAAEGLVVMDDPDSILRCTNKVYLADALSRARIATPRTLIVHSENVGQVPEELGLPCILKLPDSSFSAGVVRVESHDEFRRRAKEFLDNSDLLIAQEFVPTDFDWRVGVIDGEVLYVCKYFMARKHWQIIARNSEGKVIRDGSVENVPVDKAPRHVIRAALRATKLIGDGIYGVDLKEVRGRAVVIEVNDNPSIDAGYEDALLGEELYRRILQVFLRRVEAIKEAGKSP